LRKGGGAYRQPCGSRSGFPHFRYRFIAPLRSATPDGGATIPKPQEKIMKTTQKYL